MVAINTLGELLKEEQRYQKERSLANRLKQAKIPWNWTLATFPFKKQPVVNKSQIMSLAGTGFVEKGENILPADPHQNCSKGFADTIFC